MVDEAVAAISEFNQRAYELFAQPLIQSMSNEFLAKIGQVCRGKTIGIWTVDQLVRRSHSMHGEYFVDQTSRLYFGKINANDWGTTASAFLGGWPSDPGIACVQEEYLHAREWTTPTGEPPGRQPASDAPPHDGAFSR